MPSISLTQPVSGTVITAGLHAANYAAIQTLLNGGLDAANWASGQIFAPSKLTQEGAAVGQALVWSGTAWVPTSISADGYGTALPASPTDGQTYVLVDSITLPTYQWRFRYNAGSANTNKWELVGGAAASVVIATAETTASAAYADLATVGPSFTIPRAGVYEISLGCEVDNTVFAARSVVRVAAKLGAAATADAESAVTSFENAANVWTPTLTLPARALAAADVVKVQYKTSANTARFSRRFLAVRPVRVS